jgi:hypothetical protein
MAGPGPQQGTRVHCTLAVLDAFSAARDHIHRADQNSYSLIRAIEDLPGSGKSLVFSQVNFFVRVIKLLSGCCEHGNEPSGFVKGREFVD